MKLIEKQHTELLHINDIYEKCILINVQSNKYISRLPNNIEIQ